MMTLDRLTSLDHDDACRPSKRSLPAMVERVGKPIAIAPSNYIGEICALYCGRFKEDMNEGDILTNVSGD